MIVIDKSSIQKVQIRDYEYFAMVDNQVRDAMKRFETTVALPKLKAVYQKSNIDLLTLKEYPVEGYYSETAELREYSKLVRNLNNNETIFSKIQSCEELDYLKSVLENDLFGEEGPLTVNPCAVIRRRYDILTLTMESRDVFPDQVVNPRRWTIDRIMMGLETQYQNRTNLVELAALIGDPRLLCAGAESNILYRAYAMTSSYSMGPLVTYEYEWLVTPEVQQLGERIINEYNRLIGSSIIYPTVESCPRLNRIIKTPRVALLGWVISSEEYYYWILDREGNLEDLYSKEMLTTENLYEKVGSNWKPTSMIYKSY